MVSSRWLPSTILFKFLRLLYEFLLRSACSYSMLSFEVINISELSEQVRFVYKPMPLLVMLKFNLLIFAIFLCLLKFGRIIYYTESASKVKRDYVCSTFAFLHL